MVWDISLYVRNASDVIAYRSNFTLNPTRFGLTAGGTILATRSGSLLFLARLPQSWFVEIALCSNTQQRYLDIQHWKIHAQKAKLGVHFLTTTLGFMHSHSTVTLCKACRHHTACSAVGENYLSTYKGYLSSANRSISTTTA